MDFLENFSERISKYPFLKVSRFLRESGMLETNPDFSEEGKLILVPSDGIVVIDDRTYAEFTTPQEIQDYIEVYLHLYGMDEKIQNAYSHLIKNNEEEEK